MLLSGAYPLVCNYRVPCLCETCDWMGRYTLRAICIDDTRSLIIWDQFPTSVCAVNSCYFNSCHVFAGSRLSGDVRRFCWKSQVSTWMLWGNVPSKLWISAECCVLSAEQVAQCPAFTLDAWRNLENMNEYVLGRRCRGIHVRAWFWLLQWQWLTKKSCVQGLSSSSPCWLDAENAYSIASNCNHRPCWTLVTRKVRRRTFWVFYDLCGCCILFGGSSGCSLVAWSCFCTAIAMLSTIERGSIMFRWSEAVSTSSNFTPLQIRGNRLASKLHRSTNMTQWAMRTFCWY